MPSKHERLALILNTAGNQVWQLASGPSTWKVGVDESGTQDHLQLHGESEARLGYEKLALLKNVLAHGDEGSVRQSTTRVYPRFLVSCSIHRERREREKRNPPYLGIF